MPIEENMEKRFNKDALKAYLLKNPSTTSAELRAVADAEFGTTPDRVSKNLYAWERAGVITSRRVEGQRGKVLQWAGQDRAVSEQPGAPLATPELLSKDREVESRLAVESHLITADTELSSTAADGARKTSFFAHEISELVEGLAKKISQYVAASVSEAVAKELANLQEFVPSQPTVYKPLSPGKKDPQDAPKKRVVVVGLLPQQAGIISSEFYRELDLTFVESSHGDASRIKDLVTNSDYVLAMVNFISHKMENHLKHAKDYRRVAGGLSKLRDTLTAIYVDSLPPTQPNPA